MHTARVSATFLDFKLFPFKNVVVILHDIKPLSLKWRDRKGSGGREGGGRGEGGEVGYSHNLRA